MRPRESRTQRGVLMRITCISASNVEPARDSSASTRACEMIRDIIIAERGSDMELEIVPLIDYEMGSCRMCGACLAAGKCVRDDAFNEIHAHFSNSDAVFLVCPHYAPLPSKVMILLEKMQEIWYLNWCRNSDYRAPYYRHPIGLVAHGGQTAEALPYYRQTLLIPLANAFASVQMKVAGAGEEWTTGAAFAIQSLVPSADSIFVTITHDWDDVRKRLLPLVRNVLSLVESACPDC